MFLQQKPAPQAAPSPTPPPHILYNPTQHMLTYAGFCPSGQTLPTYPNYPIPIQVGTKTHLYGIHDIHVDYGLMMSSDRTIKCKEQQQHRGLSSGFVSVHVSQHSSSYQPSVTPQPVPEAGPASNACPSEENQNQQPSQAATQPQPHGASQEAGGYMLTPNAPALYGPSYSPFEKPPPYAC